ncbi:putative ATP-dependent RNA helicase ucp12 [Lecanora helva]
MPKGAGRGSSKKPVASSTSTEAHSNVIFGDPKAVAKKAKKPSTGEKMARDGKGAGAEVAQDTQKKPDTRTLIGGASWTGKLPVNMLSEHCQKQKWHKPEYTISQMSQSFSSMVILKYTNPKTNETVALPPFKLPPSHKHLAVQPTAVEARHFAAAYALFRVCSMRNIHMMMPPNYRDLWKKDFQDLKNEDVKEGRGWMYEADPFAAKQEREEAQAAMAKKRDEREKQKGERAGQPATALDAAISKSGDRNQATLKGWTRVPRIEMGKHMRADVESLVRREAVWNSHEIRMSDEQRQNILKEFDSLGFRASHVEEAVAECKDRAETLEWLLIHVPEDDLPRWSLPEGYSAGISMASGNLKKEASIKRLAEAGYSSELCEAVLDEHDGDESSAAEALQNALVGNLGTGEAHSDIEISSMTIADQDEDTVWTEEQETLAAIFADRIVETVSEVCSIRLEIDQSKATPSLTIRKSKSYPQRPPIVSIAYPGLPAYIRLSILRQLIQYIISDLLGQPMIFNIVDWLEHEIPRILENPGKLHDVSAAVSLQQERQPKATNHNRPGIRRTRGGQEFSPAQNIDLFDRWQARQDTPEQRKMLAARRSLPAWRLQDDIIRAVNGHQVTIISGETGSGKSTQSVQFVLDDMIKRKIGASANIVCTQPRRISALGLADRVSEERCARVGDEIGYAIRGESKHKAGVTRITFMTTGVLLRRLQTSGGSKDAVDAALVDVSHVVVDEVHERSLDTDFLLILLRGVLVRRKDLKVILMSATLDAAVFERYFSTTSSVSQVTIEGRTYPVEDYYLDDVIRLTGFNPGLRKANMIDSDEPDADSSVSTAIQGLGMGINYDFITSTVCAINSQLGSQEGGILVFLPGLVEINRSLDALRSIPNIHALPLHASLMPSEQRRVFPPAPKGKRKVIAATNVAETSITIEDIVAVIDCGKVKETNFDPQNNMVKLEEVWASRAACKQRRGRAGRVRAGTCYKLYTRNAETKMAERPEPEMRRVPLEQLCLSVRAMGIVDVAAFLASALTPPDSLAVEGAVNLLGRMGALDGENLTALGRHLSMIPADLRCGKLMVYGATFGCLESCLNIAAILTVKSPFVSPQNKRDESKAARSSFAPGQGDLICDLQAYNEWKIKKTSSRYREMRQWCDSNFLSAQTLQDISTNRSQYLTSLKETGFLPPDYSSEHRPTSLNAHNTDIPLLRALIAGAFNPQLARIEFPDKKFAPSISGAVELDPEARTIKYFNQDNGCVFVHPSSTLFDAQQFPSGTAFLSYFNKMATSKIFIRELTPFNAYSALLFSGPITLDTLGRGVVVDEWIRLRGWARIGVLVNRLRVLLDGVLARKVDEPGLDLGGDEVVEVVRRLVRFDGLDN